MEPQSSVVPLEGVAKTTEASVAASDAPSPTEQNFRNLIAQVHTAPRENAGELISIACMTEHGVVGKIQEHGADAR